MYIKRVAIEGLKGFDKAEFDFCPDGENYPGWCVVTGDNGSGKTALLKLLALAVLGPEQRRPLAPDLTGWITVGKDTGTVSVEIMPDHDVDKTEKGGAPNRQTIWAELALRATDSGAVEVRTTDVYSKKRKSAVNGPWSEATSGWFCLAYGPFRRMYGSSPDAQRLMVLPGRIPQFATLFAEDATLGEGEVWVRELQFKSLENKDSVEAKTLENFIEFVAEDFLRHGVRISKVDSDGVWLNDAADREIPLTDMSEGYRSALAMLVDVFRHMVRIYGPDILGRGESGEAIVDRPGVVLIDEVDVHLHPDWQREIGFWLTKHFPRVQFIVTTHSPLVCPAADHGRIYHLPDRADSGSAGPFRLTEEDYERVQAGRPDQILVSPAFGLQQVHSPLAVGKRARHARLEAKRMGAGLTEAEEAELQQLSLFAES